jgi:capsular polysaccharide biosynthesis protein
VRNQIDPSEALDAVFLDPARDLGVGFLSPPDSWWQLRDPGVIEAFAAAGTDTMNARIDGFLRQTRRHRTLSRVVEFSVVPVVLTDAAFVKSQMLAHGRWALTGAAGARLLNRIEWERGPGAEAEISQYLIACQQANTDARLPLAALPVGADFAIACRNSFNYFHFLSETLPQLCVLDGLGFTGTVYLHFPNAPDKTRGFLLGFIQALFPELADRVVLERAPKAYPQVLTAFGFQHSYFQLPPSVVGSLDPLAPSDLSWHGHLATRSTRAMLAMNAVDSSMIALRARGLRAIAGGNYSHLPRRFYISRAPGQARDRQMQGEAALTDLLDAFGFARLAFEDLTPLEQIALMAQAEVMVSAHGAGFANMLFANPQATVIEIGTLQTAQTRWGDFWPLAHVSGCRYVSFIADHATDMPDQLPDFASDGIVPACLTDRGLGRVMAFVAALCGHVPRLARVPDVARLAGQLLRTRHLEAADRVLTAHADLMPGQAALLLLQADLHKARGAFVEELVALHAAWAVDSTRWQTLVQILWWARRLDKPELQVWALRLLQADFPDRCAELARGRDWVQQLL